MTSPGGKVTFEFVVTNESGSTTVTIDTLIDTVFGDLDGRGSCVMPQELEPGESYPCEIEEMVTGAAGDAHTNTAEATATDNRGGQTLRSTNSVVVRILEPRPTDPSARAVTTHWTYWSENCDHLVDVWVCLTRNDTVVVDPRAISALDANNENIGPLTNLDGERGFVVVTAYKTDEKCSDGSVRGFTPADEALVGSATRANTETGYSFGNDAIGLGLATTDEALSARAHAYTSFTSPSNALVMPFDTSGPQWSSFFVVSNLGGVPEQDPPSSTYTQLPRPASPDMNILTMNPTALTSSSVVFLSLAEQSGSGKTAKIEVGPNRTRVGGTVTAFDNLEIGTSLPDYEMTCADFATIIPGEEGSLVPASVALDSSGTVRIGGINDTPREFVYAIHGQAVSSFGGSHYAKYLAGPTP